MTEDRVSCGICKEEFRPVPSQIKLICNGCYDKSNVEEILKDLKRAYKKPSLGLCWSEVKKAIEKWEGKK